MPEYRTPTYDDLKTALAVAVNMLSHLEPGDSRAVSDVFVALASVDFGDAPAPVMRLLDEALLRQAGGNYA